MSRDCPPHSPSSSGHGDSDNEGHESPHGGSPKRAAATASAVQASQGSEVSGTSSSAPSPDSRSSRLIGVSDILNPTPRVQHGLPKMSVKRNAEDAHFDTPQRISTTPQKPPSTKSLPPSPVEQGDVLEKLPPHGTFPRHMRHPVAPSSKITGSRPGLQTSPYGGAVHSSAPFAPPLTSPLQTSYHETLPSPSTASQPPHSASYPFPPHSNGRSGPPSNMGSPSSATFNSGFAHPVHPQHAHPLTTPPLSSYSQTSPQFPSHGHHSHHSQYSAPNSATTPTHGFPIMHLDTAEGQISIPIDTTAASKMADEKRKRNAGASARFRQRRKEREREMGTRISELELRLKVVEQERDHYRNLALKYAGTPLPSTANVGPPPIPRPNNHGLQLSPRLMSMANSQPLQNLPPFTSPAYGNGGQRDPRISPVGDMTRSLSSEASVMSRTMSNGHSGGHVGVGVRGISSLDSIRDVRREAEERAYDGGDSSRRSSFAADHERTYTHTPRERHHQDHYFNGIQDWPHRPIERH